MTICYFGLSKPRLARDLVYLKGLKAKGVEVLECVDSSKHFFKYCKLIAKHSHLKGKYDVIFIGYLSNLIVPLAKLISSKKIVYNALCSQYESVILDRKEHEPFSLAAWYFWLVDFMAFKAADLILVESEEQKQFLVRFFKAKAEKFQVVFTGADESLFYPDAGIKKFEDFTVIFRGYFLPATGVKYIIESAKILEPENIKFLLIGRGTFTPQIRQQIFDLQLNNVELITEFLSDDDLRNKMLASHICLGQFSDHQRLSRTIQNKTFEALALKLPYVTADSASNRELLTDRINCLFTKPADSADLANKIMFLKNDPVLQERLVENGYDLYQQKLNSMALGNQVLNLILELINKR